MAFSETTMSSIKESVSNLVQDLTTYETSDENFKRCAEFMMYHILSDKHPDVNVSVTQKTLGTFVEKYSCLGFAPYADELSRCVTNYTQAQDDEKSEEITKRWSILELLVKLSTNVFTTDTLISLDERLKASKTVLYPEEICEEERINWYEYLREGHERFQLPSEDDEESEDETVTLMEKNECSEAITTTKETYKSTPQYNDLFDQFNCRASVVEDENTMFRTALKNAVESKKWLSCNKQNSWWYEKHCDTPESKYPSAGFGITWDRAEHALPVLSSSTCSTKYQYYNEYKIIRELLWILVSDNKERVSKRIQFLKSEVSVPSLIQETFQVCVSDVLKVAENYHDILAFHRQVLDDEVLQRSFTMLAYSAVLKEVCNPFVMKISQLEQVVLEQGKINTIMSVFDELRSYMKEINFIHDTHRKCIPSDWNKEAAWLSVTRLLSMIHARLEETLCEVYLKILLIIFFKTFTVYANFIDHWLTEGKLHDWRDEFFIKKTSDNVYVAFLLDESLELGIPVASFFPKMSSKLLNCNKNVEFLCKLNKMDELRTELLKDGKLIDVFANRFISKFQPSEEPQVENLEAGSQTDEISELLKKEELFLEGSFHPYLVEAFRTELCRAHKLNKENKSNLDISKKINKLTNLKLFPVAHLIEEVLLGLISQKEDTIANLFKSSIVNEYKFFEHTKGLSGLLLMDTHRFCDRIIVRLEKNVWEGNRLFRVFLYDCVGNNKLPFSNLCHFTLSKGYEFEEEVQIRVSSIIKAINYVQFQYMVQWPMNMIFNEDIIGGFYTPLLKLVLKINTAFSCVTRLYFKDLPKIKVFMHKSRRMQIFRYWVLQLLNKLQSYLILSISQCLDCKLIERRIVINTFSNLQEHYAGYLNSVKKICLISPEMKSLDSAFNRIWYLCDDVRDLWKKGVALQLTDQDISHSVELYIQCLWYFTQVLEPFAKTSKKDSPLHILWADLTYMAEVHRLNIPEDLSFKVDRLSF